MKGKIEFFEDEIIVHSTPPYVIMRVLSKSEILILERDNGGPFYRYIVKPEYINDDFKLWNIGSFHNIREICDFTEGIFSIDTWVRLKEGKKILKLLSIN